MTPDADSREGAAERSPVTMAEGKFLRLVRRGSWEYVTRRGVTGVVGIVAVTPAGELVLVEQMRPALGVRCIELPAGLVGDVASDEDAAVAARRELLEETGYEAGKVRKLTEGVVSAGLTDEVVALYEATDLQRLHAGGGDASEAITVHIVPLAEVPAFAAAALAAGKQVDLKVWSALHFARR